MAQAGLLLQLDGSRHDWLESRGPRLTLVGAIDDATGILTGATFRDQEDVAGYLEILRDTIRRHGVPVAVYHDRHTIFVAATTSPLTLEDQLVDRRRPTQFGRALAELGIELIAAWTPQAKGRIERVWGTLQDRLVTELRLAGAADRESANVVLKRFVGRFNRRFAVPATDATPAWRPLPKGIRLEAVCCLKYRRVVAPDHTVRVGATILQPPALRGRRGYAHRRVDVELRLDGRLIVWDGSQELLARRTRRPGPAPSAGQGPARSRPYRPDRRLGPEVVPPAPVEPGCTRHQALRSDPTGAPVRVTEQLT